MTKKKIREALIKAGVKNLKEFGYPHANESNSMLNEETNVNVRPDIEAVRLELLKELE